MSDSISQNATTPSPGTSSDIPSDDAAVGTADELAEGTGTPAKPKRRFWRRLRRFVLFTVLFLVIAAYLAVDYLSDSDRVRRLVEDVLTEKTGATVTIRDAYFGLNGTLALYGVDLRIDADTTDAGRLLQAQTITIDHDMSALIHGGFKPLRIVVDKPRFYVTEDMATGDFLFEKLTRAPTDAPQTVGELPEVFCNAAEVIFGEVDEHGGYTLKGSVGIDAQLFARRGEMAGYGFFATQRNDSTALPRDATGAPKQPATDASDQGQKNKQDDPARQDKASQVAKLDRSRAVGPSLRGTFIPKTRTFEAVLNDFSVRSPISRLLPHELREYYDKLSPAGNIDAAKVSYDPEQGTDASLRVSDIALTLPYKWLDRSQLSGVNGTFVVKDDKMALDLTGKIQDPNYSAVYTITGSADGTDAEAPFRLVVDIEEAALPDQINNVPPHIKAIFNRYSPSGSFTGNVTVERKTAGEPVDVHGTVDLVNIDALYEHFPYPMSKMTGQIAFDNKTIWVKNVVGIGPTGTRLAVNGLVANQAGGEVDLTIVATEFGIDQHLYTALKKHNADSIDIIETYKDPKQYQRLVDMGLIQSTALANQRWKQIHQLEARYKKARIAATDGGKPDGIVKPLADHPHLDELATEIKVLRKLAAAPVFDLGGECTGIVFVKRTPDLPDGTEGEWSTIVEIEMKGLNLLYRYWPYPMTLTGGKVRIDGKQVELLDVTAAGLTGGGGMLSGQVEPTKLTLNGANIPVNELLLATVSEPEDAWIRALNLQGRVGFIGDVFRDDNGEVTYRIATRIDDAQALPNGGRYRLDDLDAELVIHPKGVDITRVTARHGKSNLHLTGSNIDDGLVLRAKTTGLRFEDPVLDLIPGNMGQSHNDNDNESKTADTDGLSDAKALIAKHKPVGTFDADVTFRLESDGSSSHLAQLRPSTLSFDWKGRRIALDKIKGHVDITPDRLELKKLLVHHAQGNAELSGFVSLQDGHAMTLAIDARSASIDTVTRSFLPPGVVTAIEGGSFKGPYQLRDATLRYLPQTDRGPLMTFDGVVALQNASASLGVPITEIDADLRVDVRHYLDDTWPTIGLAFDGRSLRVDGRRVTPVRANMRTSKTRGDTLLLSDLKGDVYGGVLVGEGSVRIGDQPRYHLDLKVQDASLAAVVDPEEADQLSSNKKAKAPTTAVTQSNPNKTEPGKTDASKTSPKATDPRKTNVGTNGKTADQTNRKTAPSSGNGKTSKQTDGLVSANLTLEGEPGNLRSKRGRGRIQIRDAKLVDLPVALSVLQLLNLTLPSSSSFDRAEARYLVEGERIKLDHVVFQAPSIEIFGDGWLDYPTRKVDLLMHTRNPGAPHVNVLSDIIRVIKDSLVSIHITGTLEQPRPSVVSLRGVKGSWDQVFGPLGKKPLAPLRGPLRLPAEK